MPMHALQPACYKHGRAHGPVFSLLNELGNHDGLDLLLASARQCRMKHDSAR
eukprot:gene8677-1122_t